MKASILTLALVSSFAANVSAVPIASDLVPRAAGNRKVKYGGINIAGFDFGCDTTGTCPTSGSQDVSSNGTLQMQHFVSDWGMNAFRLPVSWQYLVNNQLGGPLSLTNFGKYDQLVQGCLGTGAALCIVDVHNYARWNSGIIGQGGPTNAQFTNLWMQLAQKYGTQARVAFDLVNEPHDLNITLFAATATAAVAAIRGAGASNMILVSGQNFASAGAFPTSSGATMLGVKNPDGTTNGIIFNVHQYLDSTYSGTNPNCTFNNVNTFTSLATWLRTNGRQAFITETGGGNTQSCATLLCQQLDAINANSDVFVGVTAWAAGAFKPTYVLSAVPVQQAGVWIDSSIVTSCIGPKLGLK